MIKTIIISVLLGMVILFIGCGSGNGIVSTPGNTVNPVTTAIPSVVPTVAPGQLSFGSFSVTVKVPAGSVKSKLTASVIPYGTTTLFVTITGEAITGNPVHNKRTDLGGAGGGTYSLTVPGVPVGLNIARMSVWTSDPDLDNNGIVDSPTTAVLLAERWYGFYTRGGLTESPAGPISLGVGIEDASGDCNPQKIDIPYVAGNTRLYFENSDTVDHKVTMSGIGSINLPHPTNPGTDKDPVIFNPVSQLFPAVGIYSYSSGEGTHNAGDPGRVLVYAAPAINLANGFIDIATGNNVNAVSAVNGQTSVNFQINGSDFGTDETMVNGQIIFTDVKDPSHDVILPGPAGTIVNWGNGTITGNVNLFGGKYFIQVMVRNTPSSDAVYYYKGTGDYNVIVD